MKRTSTILLLFALAMATSVAASDSRLLNKAINDAQLKKVTPIGKDQLLMPCVFKSPNDLKFFQFMDLADRNYDAVDGKTHVHFNMCTTGSIPEDVKCQTGFDKNSFMYGFTYTIKANQTVADCKPIFVQGKENFFKYNIQTSDEKGKTDEVKQVTLTTYGDKIDFTTNFHMICDNTVNKANKATAKIAADGTLNISIRSRNACGHDAQRFLVFAGQYKIFPILLILVSIPLIFFGLKFIKGSLATIGFMSGLFFVTLLACTFMNFMEWKTKQWIVFALIAILISVIVAFVAYQSPNIAVLTGGVLLGYFVGIKLIQLYATLFKTGVSGMAIGVSAGIFMVFGLALAWKIKNIAIILTTSFSGAQLLALGIGLILKNYPDFRIISAQIKDGNTNIGRINWAYIVGTFVIFIIGAAHQHKKYLKKAEENNNDEYGQMSQDMKDGDFGNAGYY